MKRHRITKRKKHVDVAPHDAKADKPAVLPAPGKRTNMPRESEFARNVRYFRERMGVIGELLEAMFGLKAKSSPALWNRGAYLMVVGSVLETMMGRGTTVATEELATLAKILAEHRKLLGPRRETSGRRANKNGQAGDGAFPENLGEVVKRIYGTSLQTDVRGKKVEG